MSGLKADRRHERRARRIAETKIGVAAECFSGHIVIARFEGGKRNAVWLLSPEEARETARQLSSVADRMLNRKSEVDPVE